jgi:O-antigen ligase
MSVRTVFRRLLLLFFFLMLIIPATHQTERGVLLAVLLAGGAVYAVYGGWQIDRTIMMWSLVSVAAGLFFMANGAYQGAPGAVPLATVHVIWPLLYLGFIGLLKRESTLVDLQKTLVLGILVSALMGIALVAGTLAGYGALVTQLMPSQDSAAGMYDGFARYRLGNIATLVYGAGFILALLSIPHARRWCSRGWSLLLWVTLLVMLVAIVLSGRRAAWLVVLLTPVIVLGSMLLSGQRFSVRPWILAAGLAVVGFVALQAYLDLQVTSIFRQLLNAFDFTSEESASVRGEQVQVLFAEWEEKPLLGHGLGAASHVVRSAEQPWAYELSYLALLFQTGAVGIAIYGSALLWVYWTSIRTVRRRPESASVLLPLLAGLTGFLIANGTNPYLAKFDYLWVIFLPIAAIKVYAMPRPHPVPEAVHA